MSVWERVLAQLRDPLVLVLLAACLLTVVTGDFTDSAVIALVVVANTTVGVLQEIRADEAVSALASMTVPTVRVRRSGSERPVPAADVVPGDIVLLGEGDVVPADGEVMEASSLLVDESALTGESVPVGRRPRHSDGPGDEVSAGTVVVKGRAVVRVSRTGALSAMGRIAVLTNVSSGPTPLQRRMAQLGRVLALVAALLCALVLVLGLARGQPTELMVVTAISLAVAAVPESLPAVVALSLAIGARRMAARRAIVRRLPAVETLGSVTVLATDKTGTLTQAQMVVEQIWTREGTFSVSSGGLQLEPSHAGHDDVDVAALPGLRALLKASVLCNDARLVPSTTCEGWVGLGDPTEVALLVAAQHAGITRDSLEAEYPRVDEVPFDSRAQQMTTVHTGGPDTQSFLVARKGSPEALAALDGERAAEEVWVAALARAADLAARGFRVLAVESGVLSRPDAAIGHLDLLGLVAMGDPAKPAAGATIAACRAAGIVPVLVTGDHAATAVAIAERVGIVDAAQSLDASIVATGDQIRRNEVPDLTVPRVFARTHPDQKLAIVRAWQERGAVVAMTGDGVNDGPALRRADIGVAMGGRGTEVARQAADMVLADDELATLENAVEEGRRVYDNIRRFLVFGMSGGASEILLMLVGPFTGLIVPLVAAQILWVNLLTHGLTGVAMGAEPVEAGVMRRPPRPPEQSVLGDGLWQRVVLLGVVLATVSLVLGVWAQGSGRPWQTMVFLSLTCLQLGVAVGLRPVMLTRANAWLPIAVVGSYALAMMAVYLPALRDLLELEPLSIGEAAIATMTAAVGWAVARLSRPSRRTGHRR